MEREIEKIQKGVIMDWTNASKHVWHVLQIYCYSLLFTGIIIPVTAALITAEVYITDAGIEIASKGQVSFTVGVNALKTGAVASLIIWLIVAFLYYHFATAKGANKHSYGLLRNRLDELEARIVGFENNPNPDLNDTQKKNAIDMAKKYQGKIIALLAEPNIHWVLGSGYISAWNLVHQTEACLMEYETKQDLLGDALYYKWSVQDSQISHSKDLLATINVAMLDLDSTLVTDGYLTDATPKPPSTPDKERAIAALREIKNAVNIFRDDNWEGLVNSRNQLFATIIVTGLITYLVLSVVIVNRVDPQRVAAGVTYYAMGALAGLFLRLYIEVNMSKAVDDYGLAIARIITTPVLCGLAGLGGVLITIVLYNSLLGAPALPATTPTQSGTATATITVTTTTTSTPSTQIHQNQGGFIVTGITATPPVTPAPTSTATVSPSAAPTATASVIRPCTSSDPTCYVLNDVFTFDPRFLVVAAVFGLTPNLLIQTLQQRATQYMSNILSSQPQNQSN
jgi:hypothetical protein